MILENGVVLNGKYTVEKFLGQGSFGITYLVLDNTGKKLAIKEFFMRDVNGREKDGVTCGSQAHLFDNYKKKFKSEALKLVGLDSSNVIKVVEFFEENNTFYYVMEYVDGGNLDEYISLKGSLSQKECISFALKIAEALKYIHQENILHLDLKPSNIMRTKDGSIVLIDFGLAKQYDDNGVPDSTTSIGGGTPGYAPIEQTSLSNIDISGNTVPVTIDVYALGATMYKMLTGKTPPDASSILNAGFPKEKLEELGVQMPIIECIAKAMSPEKSKRFQSIDSMMAVLCQINSIGCFAGSMNSEFEKLFKRYYHTERYSDALSLCVENIHTGVDIADIRAKIDLLLPKLKYRLNFPKHSMYNTEWFLDQLISGGYSKLAYVDNLIKWRGVSLKLKQDEKAIHLHAGIRRVPLTIFLYGVLFALLLLSIPLMGEFYYDFNRWMADTMSWALEEMVFIYCGYNFMVTIFVFIILYLRNVKRQRLQLIRDIATICCGGTGGGENDSEETVVV